MIPKETCKWFNVCSLKRFYEQKKLDKRWIEDYCWSNSPDCVRKQMEEQGIPHSDNMLPDGSIDRELT
ncbi:MAG: uracil-DNA glycosylase [Candidatus Omnitrophota bacterium]|nr:uracil-DNA glycosylase [Candidatus Omnitrophota bacterium]